MSGGSYNYLVFKEPGEMLTQTEELESMEKMLRTNNRHGAADELFKYRLELETAYRRISIMHERLAGIMKAAEWYVSSDWGIEAIDDAYSELVKPLPESGANDSA